MAHVRLHRPDRAPDAAGRTGTERAAQTGQLDRIAQLGSGTVRLDVADRGRVDAGAADRLRDECRLCVGIRHGVPAGLAARVGEAGSDDAPDPVAVGDGPGQRFEQNGTDAFAGYEAVAMPVPTSFPARSTSSGRRVRFCHPKRSAPSS